MQGRMGGTKGNAARGGRDGGERRNGKEKFSPLSWVPGFAPDLCTKYHFLATLRCSITYAKTFSRHCILYYNFFVCQVNCCLSVCYSCILILYFVYDFNNNNNNNNRDFGCN